MAEDGRPCVVSFAGTEFEDLSLAPGTELSRVLTVQNSPVLFGCRTGVCGTCLVRVTGPGTAPLGPADAAAAAGAVSADEREVLDILVPDVSDARLCCQVDLQSSLTIEVIEETP